MVREIDSLSQSKYHDLLVSVDSDDFGVAVWLTSMIDEPCLVPRHCSVNDLVCIDTKHVATNALREEGWVRDNNIYIPPSIPLL